jgi:hypothetical protein
MFLSANNSRVWRGLTNIEIKDINGLFVYHFGLLNALQSIIIVAFITKLFIAILFFTLVQRALQFA